MTPKESIAATQSVGAQAPIGATMLAGGQVDAAALRQAEQSVGFEWKPGDVILDLYEVRPVTEGFGEDAEARPYHEGGFGRVYKVWHRTWRREMAVKTPRAGAFTTQEQKDAFTRECETWVNLGLHAHIAACHYVRELGGAPRVFSEYADAGTLEEWIQSRRLYGGDRQAALARMLDASIQFAWGLHYAHERGVIHQDVKPLNALLWNDGALKVTDFGLAGARFKAGLTDLAGAAAGGMHTIVAPVGGMTLEYCSPEQAAGLTLDRRTDVWSWAVSVMEMFQRGVTWQSGSLAAEALEAFLEHNGEEEGIPAMPASVADLLRRCFQHKPGDRPHTLHECATALREVLQAETGISYPRAEPQVIGDTPDTLNNRALSLLDLGKPDEAEALFDQALEKDKHHVAATYNRGLMRWRSNRCTDVDVVLSLEEIEKEHRDNPNVQCAQGWVAMERVDCAQAMSRFEKAIELGDDSEAQRGLDLAGCSASFGAGGSRTFEEHDGNVRAVVFSPDSRFALSGSEDNTAKLWDVATGQCSRTFEGHSDSVTSVGFSPDGRFALSGSNDDTLRLWEVVTGKCLRGFEGHTASVESVAFSPDGRFVLSGSDDKTLRLWDAATGQCLRIFEGHTMGVRSVAFSPDGRFALSGDRFWSPRLWDVATAECLRRFETRESSANSVVFSPDGRSALSAGAGIELWDVATGRWLRTLEGHTGLVESVVFSPDGRFALSGSDDETLRLWNVGTGRCLRTFAGHEDPVNSVAFSHDGRFALSGSGAALFEGQKKGNTLRLWDVALVMGSRDESPWFYSMIVNVQEALERQASHKARLSNARQALEVSRIAEALELLREARSVPGFERSPEVLEFQTRVGRRARIKCFSGGWLSRTFERAGSLVCSVAFSPDGRFALSGSDKTLRLWDVATGRSVRTFEGHEQQVNSVAFSPDGRFALSGSGTTSPGKEDNTLRVWEVSTGRCLRSVEAHRLRVNSVAYSPDGRCAFSGGDDCSLRLWDLATGRCLRTFPRFLQVHSVSCSPDGCYALSGDDKTLRLWDVATGQCLRTLEEHAGRVNAVAFSPDGRFALSASDCRRDFSWAIDLDHPLDPRTLVGGGIVLDHPLDPRTGVAPSCAEFALQLWDVAAGRGLRAFQGHTDNVESVAFSPDGQFALSGSDDETLRLWDVATGQCLRTFEGHAGRVKSVAFSPDSRFALSGGWDDTLRLWQLDWKHEAVESADWDQAARPIAETFLTLHTPYAAPMPAAGDPTSEAVTLALTHRGEPSWTEEDFKSLLYTLGCAGYGWLRPEGVRRELQRMARDYEGPPPLPSAP